MTRQKPFPSKNEGDVEVQGWMLDTLPSNGVGAVICRLLHFLFTGFFFAREMATSYWNV